MRDYGVGAQILIDLGVRDMILLSDRAQTLVGLEGYGLNVIDPDREARSSVPLRHKPSEMETALSAVATISEGESELGKRDG
jgi:3,4-dihydroxy 2-butanone 4-phosphate synthase/GTP cyclohydrolase II